MIDKVKETEEQKEEKSLQDLLGMQFKEDGSWIAARPSGTEPKCKFYFSIKGTDAKDAADKTEVFHKAMMELIGE